MSEPEDYTAKMTARLTEAAIFVSTYYKTLLEHGIAPDLAAVLTERLNMEIVERFGVS